MATVAAAFSVNPLSPALGAEVTGLDLAKPLDPPTVAALRRAWLDHLVLLFRGQTLSERAQVEFASHFGTPTGPQNRIRKDAPPDADQRVMLITNVRKDGEPIGSLPDGELQFHSDSAFLANPLLATVLYGVDIPSRGGDTMFVNAYRALETLDAATRARIDGLRAINVYDYTTQVKTGRLDRTKMPHASHPVVRTHPETGRKALYVNRLMTEEIEGLAEDESRALLTRLFEHIERPDLRYVHVWHPGDLLMWDNRCTQHARTDFPPGERRLLRRVGLAGDRPV